MRNGWRQSDCTNWRRDQIPGLRRVGENRVSAKKIKKTVFFQKFFQKSGFSAIPDRSVVQTKIPPGFFGHFLVPNGGTNVIRDGPRTSERPGLEKPEIEWFSRVFDPFWPDFDRFLPELRF